MPSESMAAPAAPVPAPQPLPDELTIYTVGELRPQWLAWLQALPDGQPQASIDAGTVGQVDAAGLQLLLSLDRALAGRGTALRLADPSAALRDGCAGLGLAAWLQERSRNAGAAA